MSVASLALLLVAGALAPGELRVVYDRVETSPLEWDLMCEEPPAPRQTPVGARFMLDTDGMAFRLTGAGRKLGTDSCDASSIAVLPHKVERGLSVVKVHCRSVRVVKGTEHGVQSFRFHGDGRIEVKTRMERHWRHLGESCGLAVTRATLFEPVPESDRIEQVIAAAARAKEFSELKLAHENRMPESWAIVSARYFLDNQPILKEELVEEWGPLPRGSTRTLFSGLVPQGPHVLAAEIVYEVPGTTKPVRVKVRDTLFFDTADHPTRVHVVGEENDVLFPELKDRPRIRFVLDQAAPAGAPTASTPAAAPILR